MRNIKIIGFVMTVVLLLSSCRGTKHVTSTLDGPNPEQARYESVVRNAFAYEALQSKSRYTMGGTSLNGKLCLESGKRLCLQVNAPLLGFEVARIEASQEAVIVVDKYDKMYSTTPLAGLYDVAELNGHEMEALECVMLGRIYIPGRGLATSRDFNRLEWSTPTMPNGTRGNSVGTYAGKDFTLRYAIDAQGRLASTTLMVGERRFVLEYAEYREIGKGHWVPSQENVTIVNSDGRAIKAGLTLTSPEVGESTWRDFEPSGSYRKVDVEDIVNTVKEMMK